MLPYMSLMAFVQRIHCVAYKILSLPGINTTALMGGIPLSPTYSFTKNVLGANNGEPFRSSEQGANECAETYQTKHT